MQGTNNCILGETSFRPALASSYNAVVKTKLLILMGTGCMDADWSGSHFLMERYIDTFFFPCLNALFLYLSIKFDLNIYNKKFMLR